MKRGTCESCPYWKKYDPDVNNTGRGVCRKSTPSTWKWTEPDDWCGEHPDWPNENPTETILLHPDGTRETFAEHERSIGNPNYSQSRRNG